MALYVREYDWMWTQLGLSLAECRVFAYIYGLTNKKSEIGAKGYRGSKRQLATSLGLDCGATKRILDSLEEKHLIVCTDGLWQSVVSGNESVATDNASVVSDNVSVATDNTPAPPINEIKTMEINEKNARANMRDANPVNNPSFDELLKAFKAKAGNYQIADSVLEDARRMWSSDQYSDWKRRLLIRRISEGKWLKSRFDWTVSDFDPKPEFLSGIEQEDNWRANIPMVQVKVGNSYRICTLQTQQDFDLVLIQPWLKKED